MTVDMLFMAKNKLVLRVNMCFSNLHSKIFCEIPIEDQKKWIFDFDTDDQTCAKNAKQIETLEEQTGVNLDHYYKLRIVNM